MAWNEDILVAHEVAIHPAGVLLREKALRHDDEQINIQTEIAISRTSNMSAEWRSTQRKLCSYISRMKSKTSFAPTSRVCPCFCCSCLQAAANTSWASS